MMQGCGSPEILALGTVATPLGDLMLVSDAGGRLVSCEYADLESRLVRLLDRRLGKGGYDLRRGTAPTAVIASVQ